MCMHACTPSTLVTDVKSIKVSYVKVSISESKDTLTHNITRAVKNPSLFLFFSHTPRPKFVSNIMKKSVKKYCWRQYQALVIRETKYIGAHLKLLER